MQLPPFVKKPVSQALPPNAGESRRRFVGRFCSGLLAASAATGIAACRGMAEASHGGGAHRFIHGVASGDPLADRVILWTRVTPAAGAAEREVRVRWEVARDRAMRKIVAGGFVATDARRDYTVKVDAHGLEPGTQYYYRFDTGSSFSPIGKTRTLAGLDAKQVRLAVFSCANYPSGYFNVYADAARQDELDAALHLGDYLYEYESTGYGCDRAIELGRVPEPSHALLLLADYRRRYAQYRGDPDLQALHASLPFICVWDDHEIVDDAWRGNAPAHKNGANGPYSARKAAAIQAYHEWLPIRAPDPANPEKIYRSFDFGRLASLHMLDSRLIGRDRQLDMSGYYRGDDSLDAARLRADAAAPQRQMLGREQLAWLDERVRQSRAAWQILGQQVLMASMEYPLPVATGDLDCFEYLALCRQAEKRPGSLSPEQKSLIAAPTVPCYLDSWDGYAAERERILRMMRRHDRNLVVLAGDTHNAWASNLLDAAGNTVGVEFATASVSSPGLECAYTEHSPDTVARMMEQLIRPLCYAHTGKRGYMILTVTGAEVRCDWRFVDTVFKRAFVARTERSLRTLAGAGQRRIVELA